MKILAVSLLRLGDFIMISPVLAGLKKKYPGADIDVLAHSSVKSLKPMISGVNRWWTIDRDELQAGLGRADLPLLTSYDILKEQLDEICAEKYDLIINLTHTIFSGWICGYIRAGAHLGLAFDSRGQARFHSPWFRYLDEHSDSSSKDMFHFIDLFHHACELKGERVFPFQPTAAGRAEVDSLELSNRDLITLQVMTSDAKKTWSLKSWKVMLECLQTLNPSRHFVLLGAPNEKAHLERLHSELNAKTRAQSSVAILSLNGALELLNRSELLISGDTSIKHLANAARARVVEIGIGPSDHRRTGIYKADSLILRALLPCAPCAHSAPCSQSSHLCAEQLEPTSVATVIDAYLKHDHDVVAKIANSVPFEVLRTHHLRSDFSFACSVTIRHPEHIAETLIERCAWKFFNTQELKKRPGEFGTVGVELTEEIKNLVPAEMFKTVIARLDFIETDLLRHRQNIEFARSSLLSRPKELLAPKIVAADGLIKMQNQIAIERERAEIKQKIVRSLKFQLMELL